jgi:hypothetical protein
VSKASTGLHNLSKKAAFFDRFGVYVDPANRKVTQVPVRRADARAISRLFTKITSQILHM